MFDVDRNIIVVESVGYESVLKHRHNFIEIVYVKSGEAIHNIDGRDLKIRAGDLFVIATASEHSIRPVCDEKDFCIINIVCSRELFADVEFPPPEEIFSSRELHYDRLVEMIEREYKLESSSEYVLSLLVRNLINLCFIEKTIKSRGKDLVRRKKKFASDYIQRTIDFIQEHYMDKIMLKDIADAVGLYPAYLQRIFRKNRSTSVMEYLLRYRMEQACRYLLDTDLPIAEISHRVGFGDIKNFYTTFRRFFNVTPKEYRETRRGESAE